MDKTLLKGLAVLEAVVEQQGRARTIEELAAELKLTKSNVHRTLQTLAHAKYLAKNESTGSYHSTMKLFELGAKQLSRFDVRTFAPPFMRALADETGETVHLSILEGFSVVYIDKIDSPQPVRSYTAIGGRAPAYAVATGKAMLAYQPDGYLDRHADELKRHTQATIASLPVLKEELARVVRTGYAVNRGEWRETVGGLAVTIFNGLNQVVAALGISGPLERLSIGKLNEFAPLVKKNAAEISKAMGYRGG
ncbi:IclR family transcriptional regulator [Piscinibacter sakaiensis]|uniref:IclR family transcriptional regulator n=1 Tax=Piscinibacter sakaiensis TaxID=1547922 RepID=UPI0006B66164|nr:IclR family transcriptional regulator [Piscinibacter sakaiensis]